mmetsp:Transcript_19903/g.25817  ORF Transcript_19903/g.25817 Transcript_19903/m.25817 type:complete len:298 (+) Transcript_19903:205-1098(+)
MSQNLKTIRVGGVPEHFNAPWHIANEKGRFAEVGTKVEFTKFPGGTGAMCKALSANEVDVALLLTEGAVVHATKDSSVKILGVYVDSPLVWGVHVGKESSSFTDLSMLKGKSIFAISRFGSGSHLMAYVLAKELGFDTENDMKFEVVGNLDGARKALPENGNLVFMWEKHMTSPFVDKGEFARIGEQPTPWPCFVIAARDDFLKENSDALRKTIDVVREECLAFKNGGSATVDYINKEYGIDHTGAETWLNSVQWNCSVGLDKDMLLKTGQVLHSLGRLDQKPDLELIESITASIGS